MPSLPSACPVPATGATHLNDMLHSTSHLPTCRHGLPVHTAFSLLSSWAFLTDSLAAAFCPHPHQQQGRSMHNAHYLFCCWGPCAWSCAQHPNVSYSWLACRQRVWVGQTGCQRKEIVSQTRLPAYNVGRNRPPGGEQLMRAGV